MNGSLPCCAGVARRTGGAPRRPAGADLVRMVLLHEVEAGADGHDLQVGQGVRAPTHHRAVTRMPGSAVNRSWAASRRGKRLAVVLADGDHVGGLPAMGISRGHASVGRRAAGWQKAPGSTPSPRR